jgi:hypothetical protein
MTAAATAVVVPSSIIAAGALTPAPKPEADKTLGSFTATFTAGPQKLCPGEDGGTKPFVTVAVTLSGTSTDTGPAADFKLTGKLTEHTTVTVNTATGVGWGTGTITITNGTTKISGPTTMVIEPNSKGMSVSRGFWQPTVTVGTAVTPNTAIIQYESSPGSTATSVKGAWGGPATVGDLSVKNTAGHC